MNYIIENLEGSYFMLNKNFCAPEKLAILNEIVSCEIGLIATSKKYSINKTTLLKWQRYYQVFGYEWLERRAHIEVIVLSFNIKR